MSTLRGLLKPNKYKVVITLVLAAIYIAGFFYVFAAAICVAPSCPNPNAFQKTISPFFGFTSMAYVIFTEIGDFLFFKRTYISADMHTTEPRFNYFISEAGVFVFHLLGTLFMLAIGYILSCVMYATYTSLKLRNTNSKK